MTFLIVQCACNARVQNATLPKTKQTNAMTLWCDRYSGNGEGAWGGGVRGGGVPLWERKRKGKKEEDMSTPL